MSEQHLENFARYFFVLCAHSDLLNEVVALRIHAVGVSAQLKQLFNEFWKRNEQKVRLEKHSIVILSEAVDVHAVPVEALSDRKSIGFI
jgi:hypothetical protein